MTIDRLLPALLAAAFALLLPAAAAAAPQEYNLDASFQTTITPPRGEQVQTTRMMTMWVPRGVRAAGEKMPSCDPVAMETRGAQVCRRRSLVGRGTAKGWVFDTVEPMTVTLYNGPHNTLLARVVGLSPVSLDVVVRGRITRPAGGRYGYGQKLEFPFPDSLIYPVPGATASMIYLSAHLDRKAGWLRSTSCPPEGWSLGALLEGLDGSSTSMKADIACVGAPAAKRASAAKRAPAPKPPRERKLDASLQTTLSVAPGQVMSPTRSITMWMPKGFRAAGDTMPSCDPARLRAEGPGACPPKSQVGSGQGTSLITRPGAPPTDEPLSVVLFNGPGNTLLALTRGSAPVPIDAVVQATVGRAAGGAYGYGQVLRFPFPEELIHPQPGVVASMTALSARLDGGAGWLRSTSCPPRGWSLGALLTSVDGGETKIMADLACV